MCSLHMPVKNHLYRNTNRQPMHLAGFDSNHHRHCGRSTRLLRDFSKKLHMVLVKYIVGVLRAWYETQQTISVNATYNE